MFGRVLNVLLCTRQIYVQRYQIRPRNAIWCDECAQSKQDIRATLFAIGLLFLSVIWDGLQISLLVLSKFRQINQLPFLLKSSGNLGHIDLLKKYLKESLIFCALS